jgi:hypothetical protein
MNQHNTIPELKVLGPDCVPAWTDLYHVNDLCDRCEITFNKVDEPEGWELDCIEADRTKMLWTDERGPTLQEVRSAAHRGCHFCTMIISDLLVGRRNMRLGAGDESLGWNRRGQDTLYESDRVHLLVSKDVRGNSPGWWGTDLVCKRGSGCH